MHCFFIENGSKIRMEINVFFNKGGFGRPGGRRMSIVTTFRSRFGGVRFLMIFRSAKKTSKNWKKLKKCDFGAPGACRSARPACATWSASWGDGKRKFWKELDAILLHLTCAISQVRRVVVCYCYLLLFATFDFSCISCYFLLSPAIS